MGELIMTIELNEYGLMIDLGDFLYVSLSWAFLILSALIFVGAKVYNKIKSNKRVSPILNDYSDEWMTK
jgi:large-conductance mechanosensitive channel